jgi:hypothetical protein
MTADTTELYRYAVHHGHLAAVSLFRPLPKMPASKRARREIIHASPPGAKNPYKFHIVCAWELDADDESVLMALLAIMAPADRRKIVPSGRRTRGLLDERGGRVEEDTIAAVATRREILTLLGWDTNGRSYDRLEESLTRLENTNIHYFSGSEDSQFSRLIAVHRRLYRPDERDGGNSLSFSTGCRLSSSSARRRRVWQSSGWRSEGNWIIRSRKSSTPGWFSSFGKDRSALSGLPRSLRVYLPWRIQNRLLPNSGARLSVLSESSTSPVGGS